MANKSLFDVFFSSFRSEKPVKTNQITSGDQDGAVNVGTSKSGLAQNSYSQNLNWVFVNQKTQITNYRNIASHVIVDYAIGDIVNEVISFDENEDPIELDLSDLTDGESAYPESIAKSIRDSWENITDMLDLKGTIHRRMKQFYIDGRLAYQKVVNVDSEKSGLLRIIELDPINISKTSKSVYDEKRSTFVEEVISYIYDESQSTSKGRSIVDTAGQLYKKPLVIAPESITFVTSGLKDRGPKGEAIGWLDKAIRPANNLRMMENALLIYRITRAPERRIFTVDTSGVSPDKVGAALQEAKAANQNRMQYNNQSGSFYDARHAETMQEDYYIARNGADAPSTTIDTLPGGQVGEIPDVDYFRRDLYMALNIPISRMEDNAMMAFGRVSEISRDELKYSKFASSIRKRFNLALLDMLGTDLILKGVLTENEWEETRPLLNFKYAQDFYLEEQKKNELIRDRIDLAKEIQPFVGEGGYVSHKYIMTDILSMTDEEIKLQQEEISDEVAKGLYRNVAENLSGEEVEPDEPGADDDSEINNTIPTNSDTEV